MNKKWFVTAALKDSGFEHLADNILEPSEITGEMLKKIDLLFVKDKAGFFSGTRFSGSTVISDKPVFVEDQEKYLLFSYGETFISRIGHDVINLFTPFEHFEYLEPEIITERVSQGIRFGRQINTIGHLLQNTRQQNTRFYDFDNFIQTINDICRKSSINLTIKGKSSNRIDTIPDTVIMRPVIDEIISNWVFHGSGDFELEIKSSREVIFRNSFKGSFSFERPKATLRCPFTKRTNSPGAGLGLFVVSLSSVAGGFEWDISIKDNCFCLSFVF